MCKIKFEIKKPGSVAIRVVDVVGTPITLLFNAYDSPGRYEVDFNEENLMPGRYYYRIYDTPPEMAIAENVQLNGSTRLLQAGTLKIGNNVNLNVNEI